VTGPLDVLSVATVVPPRRTHKSRLGAPSSGLYHHLYEPAGNFSRPDGIPRGVLTKWSAPYEAPAAEEGQRCSDLALEAATAAAGDRAGTVASTFHVQCTLDQQIVGSAALRLQHDLFRTAAETMGVGQTGTAGVPTALRLAAATPLARGRAIAVVAADKWIAPHYRRKAETPHGDAAGCCLLGRDAERPVARLLGVHTLVAPPLAGFWHAGAAAVEDHLAAIGATCVDALLARAGAPAAPRVIVGDAPASALAERVAAAAGLPASPPRPGDDVHLGSAALVHAVCRGVEQAVETGAPVELVAWTACPSGNAGAVLLRCDPGAVATLNGWTSFPTMNG